MKYYGDEWLYLRDAYSNLTKEEQIIFMMQSGISLVSDNEMAYISGMKKQLAYKVIYFHALNDALRRNPDKYKKMFEDKKLIVDFRKLQKQETKPQELSMFR